MFSVYRNGKGSSFFIDRQNCNKNMFIVVKSDGFRNKKMKYLGTHPTMQEAQDSLDEYADRAGLIWCGELDTTRL